tara:strand:+ start:644 stop:1186 length:543 start_codon:yes stop_codon:yes gene_type:complete
MAGPIVKGILRTAGTALGSFLDEALTIGGTVGQQAATSALRAGKAKFAPELVGAVGKEVPRLLRESSRSTIPKAGKLIGQGATLGGLFALGNYADQQSDHTQPMSKGTGVTEMDRFLMDQQLQNQKFMHEMALISNRAESRTPGAQYNSDAVAEQQAFSRGVLDEVGAIGRMTMGTGFRA